MKNKEQFINLFVNNIGDLGQGRLSYFRFLFEGLQKELAALDNPIIISADNEKVGKNQALRALLYFHANDIKIKLPHSNHFLTGQNKNTYLAQIFIAVEYWYPARYSHLFSKSEFFKRKNNDHMSQSFLFDTQFEEKDLICEKHFLCLAEIPFMIEEGSFVINGFEKVVINQIIRSPGIYFKKEYVREKKLKKKSPIYTATLISDNGQWTKIFLDTQSKNFNQNCGPYITRPRLNLERSKAHRGDENSFEYKNGLGSSLYLYDMLSWYGLSSSEILGYLKYPEHYLQYIEKKIAENLPKSRKSLGDEISSFYSLNGNQKFLIGKIGRYKLNKRLQLNLPDCINFLTVHDLIAIINILMDFKYLIPTPEEDDIDHIKNKYVRSVGDLLQLRFKSGLIRMMSQVRQNLGLIENKIQLKLKRKGLKLNSLEIQEGNSFLKESEAFDIGKAEENFLALNPSTLSAHKREANLIGYFTLLKAFNPFVIKGEIESFFTTSEISQFFDQTNPLSAITHRRRVSVFGPNGLQRENVSTSIRDIHPSQYARICPIETAEGHNAGLITSLALFGQISSLGWIEAPYFYAESGHVFSDNAPIFVSPQAESEVILSFSATMPTNGNKLVSKYGFTKEDYLFSTAKNKLINFFSVSPLQLLSAATTLTPFLEHNDANRVLMGSNMQRQAVPLIFAQKPIVGTGLEAAISYHSSMVVKSFCSGIVVYSSAKEVVIIDSASLQKIIYPFQKNSSSNQETFLSQKPSVWSGENVVFGQIIGDGPGISDGELSLGRNLLVAYMPWEGYNYEDAIIISQRLLDDDCLTSIHIEEHETILNFSSYDPQSEILSSDIPNINSWLCRHLDLHTGIVKIGSYVSEYDILVGKKVLVKADVSPLSKLMAAIEKGENISPKKHSKKSGKKEVDANLGYVYHNTSLYTPRGTFGKVIETRITHLKNIELDRENYELDDYISGDLIRIFIAKVRKVQVGDKLAGRHGNKGIISKILASRDMPYLPDGTPIDIILNPLGVPSRMNVGQVFEGLLGLAGEKLGCRFKISPFDESYGQEASRALVNKKLKEAANFAGTEWLFNSLHLGKIFLRDGRTGDFFDNPITVGKSYILRLVHMVDDKLHVRSTGPYTMITEQPLAGKSHHGGQRFGEMEVWALEAFGCSHTLQELLTIKSDDIDGRNDMYSAISSPNCASKPTPNISETYLVLIRELNALGLDFVAKQTVNAFKYQLAVKSENVDFFEEIETRLKLRSILEENFNFYNF